MKQWDVTLGVAGAATTWTMADSNSLLAFIIGLLTIVLLCYRVRRAHLRRNYDFTHDAQGNIETKLPAKIDKSARDLESTTI